jgi:hypothetical protein
VTGVRLAGMFRGMRVRFAVTGAVVALIQLAGCGSSAVEPVVPGASSAAAPNPVASASGQVAASTPVAAVSAGGVRLPPVNAVFDYQIGGAYPPVAGVGIVDRDRDDPPVPDRYNICYVNAFQTQPGENGWWKQNHDDLLLKRDGTYVEDPNWPGELILDLSASAKRNAVTAIVGTWIAGCAAKGYQAIEPDNLDSWTRSRGLMTQADALEYAKLLVAAAHQRGLAIAQKNTPEFGRAGFDFAIAEECAVFDECGRYLSAYGDHVVEIEYTDNPRAHYEQACGAQGKRVSVILRDRQVVAAGKTGYHYENC